MRDIDPVSQGCDLDEIVPGERTINKDTNRMAGLFCKAHSFRTPFNVTRRDLARHPLGTIPNRFAKALQNYTILVSNGTRFIPAPGHNAGEWGPQSISLGRFKR